MKIFALYLPQYHEIPENNKWWGKGFTEWVNVKKAKPLFKGHVQPKHPLNNNYYNLLNKDTVVWQTDLMKKHGISGMIYYHYYFNGKLLLEKPAENLLQWKDIDQPFFFCWANRTWFRSWEGSRKVLIEQTYGNKDAWRKHFEYLLPFFKDDRYEKVDNKPVFMLYDSRIQEKQDMFRAFDTWCKEAGFDGLYLIEECYSIPDAMLYSEEEKNNGISTSYFLAEPLVGKELWIRRHGVASDYWNRLLNKMNQKGIVHHLFQYSGDDIMKLLIRKQPHDKKIVPGIFFEWDNTPRHGERGYIINPPSKTTFFNYMNSIKYSDYAVINAWNEWCEGMMLEPSEENGYRYLKWIKEWQDKENETN